MPRQPTSAVKANDALLRETRARLDLFRRLGIPERRVAEAAGVNVSTVHRVRTGEIRRVTRTTARALLNARPR